MLSSTSSSSDRIRPGFWKRTWLLAMAVTLGVLGAWETFWRAAGYWPAVQDDWGLWAAVRRAVNTDDLVLVGSSRIQVGLHPDAFARETGLRPLMLAIDGSSPIPVLRDLSRDRHFAGTVICSMLPIFLGEPSENFDRAQEWIQQYQNQKWSSRIETRLSVRVQQHLVFRYPGLLPGQLSSDIVQSTWPQPPYAGMRSDRYRPADFSTVDAEKIRSQRIEREKELHAQATPLSPTAFADKVQSLNRMVDRIQNRGGRVIFVRFPSTGKVRELEHQTWPRKRYWNVFAARIHAAAVHFEDYRSLSGFPCPDGSHLDVRHAVKFTRNLSAILMEKNLLAAFPRASIRKYRNRLKPKPSVSNFKK